MFNRDGAADFWLTATPQQKPAKPPLSRRR